MKHKLQKANPQHIRTAKKIKLHRRRCLIKSIQNTTNRGKRKILSISINSLKKNRIMQLNCSAAAGLHTSCTGRTAFLVQNICLFWFLFSVENYSNFISFHPQVLPQQSYRRVHGPRQVSAWTMSKLKGKKPPGKRNPWNACSNLAELSLSVQNIKGTANGATAACTSTKFTLASDANFQRSIQKAYWRRKY